MHLAAQGPPLERCDDMLVAWIEAELLVHGWRHLDVDHPDGPAVLGKPEYAAVLPGPDAGEQAGVRCAGTTGQ